MAVKESGPDRHVDSPGTAGDEAMVSGEELVRVHGSTVLAICLTHTSSVDDAEDVMQEVFLKAVRKLDTLRNRGNPRAWLVQIARRACFDHQRRRPATQQLPDDLAIATSSRDSKVVDVRAAISKLPEGYREAIALYYLDGRSCRNVAASLAISEAAVRQRLVRARLMLHDLLVEDES